MDGRHYFPPIVYVSRVVDYQVTVASGSAAALCPPSGSNKTTICCEMNHSSRRSRPRADETTVASMPKDFSIAFLLDKAGSSSTTSTEYDLDNARVRLDGASLWRRFHALGTEMIVTKSGRRMFPTLSISLSGLNPNASYSLMVDLQCVDNKRYRYSFHQSKWTATGPGEAELPCRTFVHPDSPATGAHWMKSSTSFDKIKLTNNQMDNNGYIIVNSMHRYRPRIHIVRHGDDGARRIVQFEETAFVAVTAYQNHRITSLKIESNPFAKGFRECEMDDPRLLPFLLPFYNLAFPFKTT